MGCQATSSPVKKKALSFVKSWAKQIEETGDPNLGLMGELYDQLRAKSGCIYGYKGEDYADGWDVYRSSL